PVAVLHGLLAVRVGLGGVVQRLGQGVAVAASAATAVLAVLLGLLLVQRALAALEQVVERLLEVAADRDLLTEADHDLLEQRVGGVASAAGLHVQRFDVEQAVAERQGEQVAVGDLRRALLQRE